MSTVSDAPATQQLLIGGAWRDADGGRTHDVIGAGERPVTRQAAASAADARAAAGRRRGRAAGVVRDVA